jgi:hypothetical protein
MKPFYSIALIVLIGLLQGLLFIYANAQCLTFSEDLAIISGLLNGFSHGLREGLLYPRWIATQFDGTGAPTFVIYSPLAFFLGSAFALPARIDPFGINQLGLAMCAGVICSALTAYLWLRRHASVGMSTLLACVLLLVPTRFLVFQIQAGLANIWATVWFPVALYFAERWREDQGRPFLAGFTLALALILLTHTPSAILYWPVLALYACYYRPPVGKTLAGIGVSLTLAVGLCSVYLLPAWLNRPDISMARYFHAFNDYNAIFLPLDSVLLYFVPKILVDALPFIVLAVVALWLARPGSPIDDRRSAVRWCALVVVVSSVLFTPLSQSMWEQLELLRWLQAPFRFLALFFVLSPILLMWISRRVPLAVLFGLLSVFLVPAGYHAWNDYDNRRDVSRSTNGRGIQKLYLATQTAATEYKTVWMPDRVSRPGDFLNTYGSIRPVALSAGSGAVRVISWEGERITLHVKATTPATIRIRQNFFPAWRAEANNVPLRISPDQLGLQLIDAPAGVYDIVVSFSRLKGEATGGVLSLVSLFLVGTMCCRSWFRIPLANGDSASSTALS